MKYLWIRLGLRQMLCKPRHPFTKGKVERLVRYVKTNFLVYRVFGNITDLNFEALKWCDTRNSEYSRAVADILSKSRHSFGALVFHPACALGPIALLVVAACGFYDHSFWRSETMMLTSAMLAMAGSAFPAPKKADKDSLTEK